VNNGKIPLSNFVAHELAQQIGNNPPKQPCSWRKTAQINLECLYGLGVYRMMLIGGDACARGMVSTIARTIKEQSSIAAT
jgi:hypothetical protein